MIPYAFYLLVILVAFAGKKDTVPVFGVFYNISDGVPSVRYGYIFSGPPVYSDKDIINDILWDYPMLPQ